MINLYLAPMEELTGYIFRREIARHFGYIDKYFTPFISPDNRIMKTRSVEEISPSNNEGLIVVPQLLTNDPSLFNDAAKLLAGMGYEEININFGCPSNTVATKCKGSGILRAPDIMERFLDGVFDKKDSALKDYPDLRISVKTRIGYNNTSDLENVCNVLGRYPFCEIIVHPRLKKDLYNGRPRMDMFDMACDRLKSRIIYNGDIFSKSDYEDMAGAIDDPSGKYHGKVTGIMIGRGAVTNPGIFRQIRTGQAMTITQLYDFLSDLYEAYKAAIGTGNAISKMKEVWSYTTRLIPDEKERAGVFKNILKSSGEAQYKDSVMVARSRLMLL